MDVATLVTVQDYLATAYHPDCDLVDGVLIARNVGQKDHSKLQGEVFAWFRERRRTLNAMPLVEQRVQVGKARYRIPDVSVVHLPEPDEQVLTAPPYICIEILSPEDSFSRLQERFEDYMAMGVPNVWALDPQSRRGWRITAEGHFEARDGVLRSSDGRVTMPIAGLFDNPI